MYPSETTTATHHEVADQQQSHQSVTSQQPLQTDTTLNSVTTSAGDLALGAGSPDGQASTLGNDQGLASSGKHLVSDEEFALIEEVKRYKRQRALEDRIKLHSKVFSSRRITVALRRINLKEKAPDADVLAYIEVGNLKSVAGQKAEVTEKEMKAYLSLFFDGVECPTLAAISDLAAKL